MNLISDSKPVSGVSSSKLEERFDKLMVQKQKLRNIAVSEANYFALQRMGFAGESFNDVVSRLVKAHNSK